MLRKPTLAIFAVLTAGSVVVGLPATGFAKDPVATLGKSTKYDTNKKFQWTEYDRLVDRYYAELNARDSARARQIGTGAQIGYLLRKIDGWTKELNDPEKKGIHKALRIVIEGARKDIEQIRRMNAEARRDRIDAAVGMVRARQELERLGYYFEPHTTRPAINLDPRRFSYQNRQRRTAGEADTVEADDKNAVHVPVSVAEDNTVADIPVHDAVFAGPVVLDGADTVIDRHARPDRRKVHGRHKRHHARAHDEHGDKTRKRETKRHKKSKAKTLKRSRGAERSARKKGRHMRKTRSARRHARNQRRLRNMRSARRLSRNQRRLRGTRSARRMGRNHRRLRGMRLGGRHAFRGRGMGRMRRGGFRRF